MKQLNFEESTKRKFTQSLFLIILVVGLVLRFYQYLMGRSLWEDECHLVLNIMKYGYLGLLKPLDYIQGAPILFLWILKTLTKIFGYNELAFRAFPFLASVLTLPLFYYAILSLTKSRVTALIGFLIFSLNLALIYFSSEVKPYAVDVSVYVLMLYLALSPHDFVAKRRDVLLTIFGCISLMISLSAFIVLFAVAGNMALSWYNSKNIKRSDIKILAAWFVVFILNYFFFIHNHPSTEQQRINYGFAFCPTDILSCEFVTFLKATISDVFYTLIFRISEDFAFGYVLLLIFFVGIVHLIRRKKYTLLIFTCLPILLHLGLSALKIYPFIYRLILYLTPAFIILMAYGTTIIAKFLTRKLHVTLGIIVVLFCCYSFNKESVKQFPLWYREVKPALNFINDSISPNAHVYATDPVHAYMYYHDRGYAKKPLYRELPWDMVPAQFYQLVSNERSNYVLLYSTNMQWGYGTVIEDIKKNNLVVKHFEYKGFAVSELKPMNPDSTTSVKMIDYTYFPKDLVFGDQHLIALWSNYSASAKSFSLSKGKYSVSVVAKGTPAGGIYPHLNLFMNEQKLGDFYIKTEFSNYTFNFDLEKETNLVFKLDMDNDAIIKDEDRNALILFLDITERKHE